MEKKEEVLIDVCGQIIGSNDQFFIGEEILSEEEAMEDWDTIFSSSDLENNIFLQIEKDHMEGVEKYASVPPHDRVSGDIISLLPNKVLNILQQSRIVETHNKIYCATVIDSVYLIVNKNKEQ